MNFSADILFPVFAFLIGIAFGSFSNVCIYRIPKKISIITPQSQCPFCNTKIKPLYNIPIISFLILGGKCHYCQSHISWRYPIVETITGLIYLFLYLKFQLSPLLFIYALLCSSLIIIAFIDLEYKIIPDIITLPGILIGLIISFIFSYTPLTHSIKGLLIGGGLFYLIAILSRGGMGGGDIKLIAMIGSFLGWEKVLLTIFLGSLSGSIIGIILIILRKKGRKDTISFGPFLSLGTIVSIFFGNYLISLWFSIILGQLYVKR